MGTFSGIPLLPEIAVLTDVSVQISNLPNSRQQISKLYRSVNAKPTSTVSVFPQVEAKTNLNSKVLGEERKNSEAFINESQTLVANTWIDPLLLIRPQVEIKRSTSKPFLNLGNRPKDSSTIGQKFYLQTSWKNEDKKEKINVFVKCFYYTKWGTVSTTCSFVFMLVLLIANLALGSIKCIRLRRFENHGGLVSKYCRFCCYLIIICSCIYLLIFCQLL